MAKPAPAPRKSKPAAPAKNPIQLDDRTEKKPQGRPRESAEKRRHFNFMLEESIADRFDELAEAHRAATGGKRHGSGKAFLVHLINSYVK